MKKVLALLAILLSGVCYAQTPTEIPTDTPTQTLTTTPTITPGNYFNFRPAGTPFDPYKHSPYWKGLQQSDINELPERLTNIERDGFTRTVWTDGVGDRIIDDGYIELFGSDGGINLSEDDTYTNYSYMDFDSITLIKGRNEGVVEDYLLLYSTGNILSKNWRIDSGAVSCVSVDALSLSVQTKIPESMLDISTATPLPTNTPVPTNTEIPTATPIQTFLSTWYVQKSGDGMSGPLTMVSINSSIIVSSPLGNPFESGRIRFHEGNFTGGYIHYDGSNDLFNIGVHNLQTPNATADIPVIQIKRDGSAVTILKNTIFLTPLAGSALVNAYTPTPVWTYTPVPTATPHITVQWIETVQFLAQQTIDAHSTQVASQGSTISTHEVRIGELEKTATPVPTATPIQTFLSTWYIPMAGANGIGPLGLGMVATKTLDVNGDIRTGGALDAVTIRTNIIRSASDALPLFYHNPVAVPTPGEYNEGTNVIGSMNQPIQLFYGKYGLISGMGEFITDFDNGQILTIYTKTETSNPEFGNDITTDGSPGRALMITNHSRAVSFFEFRTSSFGTPTPGVNDWGDEGEGRLYGEARFTRPQSTNTPTDPELVTRYYCDQKVYNPGAAVTHIVGSSYGFRFGAWGSMYAVSGMGNNSLRIKADSGGGLDHIYLDSVTDIGLNSPNIGVTGNLDVQGSATFRGSTFLTPIPWSNIEQPTPGQSGSVTSLAPGGTTIINVYSGGLWVGMTPVP